MSKILKLEESLPQHISVRRPSFGTFTLVPDQRKDRGARGAPDDAVGPEDLLRQAQQQAALLLERARSEARQVREDAFHLGHDEGKRLAAQEARTELASALQAVQDLLAETQAARDEILSSMEAQIVGLVLAVAEKIIREQSTVDRDMALRAVKEAVEQVGTRELIKISVNPDDLVSLEAYWSETYGDRKHEPGLDLTGDPRVERGGCIVETRTAVIDTRIGVQLASVARAFMREVEAK